MPLFACRTNWWPEAWNFQDKSQLLELSNRIGDGGYEKMLYMSINAKFVSQTLSGHLGAPSWSVAFLCFWFENVILMDRCRACAKATARASLIDFLLQVSNKIRFEFEMHSLWWISLFCPYASLKYFLHFRTVARMSAEDHLQLGLNFRL